MKYFLLDHNVMVTEDQLDLLLGVMDNADFVKAVANKKEITIDQMARIGLTKVKELNEEQEDLLTKFFVLSGSVGLESMAVEAVNMSTSPGSMMSLVLIGTEKIRDLVKHDIQTGKRLADTFPDIDLDESTIH